MRLIKLVATKYYNDFYQIEKDSLTKSASGAAGLVFRMLAWRIAEEEHKALPFAKVFHLLRASFNLHKFVEGIVEIGNEDGRLDALEDLIEATCVRSNCAILSLQS